MPSWKKLISSGSSAVLSSLTLDSPLAVAQGGTGAATLTSGYALLGNGTSAPQMINSTADSTMLVGNGSTMVAETGATLRTSIGVGTGDSPQFTAVNIGAASDTTLARSSAGVLSVEGNVMYHAGGTDVVVADGGTGASTFTDGGILFGNGTDAIQASAVLSAGEILIGDGTTEPTILDVGSASGIEILGTIGTGVWQGTEIGLGYGGTELVGETDGKIVVADGNGAPVHLDIGSSTAITILGTIATGTWEGSSISTTYTDAKVTSVSAGDGIDVDTTTGAVTVTAEDASTTNPGVVELATTAETTTGTDTARAVTPDGLKDGYQGSTNVTTLGTIATGTWEGTTIAVDQGGTGVTTMTALKNALDDETWSFANAVNIDATTTSTNKTSGALIVDGGVGVAENIHAGGDVVAYASSDERLKDNIEVIENSLDKVGEIRGVTFNWNEESPEWAKERGRDVGVIAQEVRKVLPEIVVERTNGYLGVDYKRIIPLLIESIKELKQEVEDLKKKVN